MTKISYIAGQEAAQRAEGIKPAPFIPYLSLTKGEMALALMQEQAQILAGFYGSQKYKDAETMLQNALYRGLHGSTPYLGAYDPDLRPLARVINQARRQTQPASKELFSRAGGIGKGVHIGDPIIPTDTRNQACMDAAAKLPAAERLKAQAKCVRAFKIEKILNEGLETNGQYLAYGYLPKGNALPQTANLKIYNQELAQADIARVGKFDMGTIQLWLNTGMMRANAQVAKIPPYGWINTNAILTSLPEAGQQEIISLLQRHRGASSDLSNKLASIVKKYGKGNGIGDPVTVTIAIIGAIATLIGPISEFVKALRIEQADAFAQVNGMGTIPFGPQQGDWDGDGIPNNQDPTPNSSSGDNTLLYLGAGAAALYFLTK